MYKTNFIVALLSTICGAVQISYGGESDAFVVGDISFEPEFINEQEEGVAVGAANYIPKVVEATEAGGE